MIIPPVFHFDICDPDQTFARNSVLRSLSGVLAWLKKYGRLSSLMWSAKAWSSAVDIRTALTLLSPPLTTQTGVLLPPLQQHAMLAAYSQHLWLHFKAPTVTLPESTT